MTDADIVRGALHGYVSDDALAALDRLVAERDAAIEALEANAEEFLAHTDALLARFEQAERERDEAREDAADARGYLEAVRVMRDRYEARYGKHRQRAEAAERERDTLRHAIDEIASDFCVSHYKGCDCIVCSAVAAVSPPQEGEA